MCGEEGLYMPAGKACIKPSARICALFLIVCRCALSSAAACGLWAAAQLACWHTRHHLAKESAASVSISISAC
jgi:hypothetical protein